jgi:hypothetical protein
MKIKALILSHWKTYRWLLLLVIVVFTIGSNIAWLNPRPKYQGNLIKLSEKIPFMWQYDLDAGLELNTAAFFPAYYHRRPVRINRPTYPLLVRFLAEPLYWCVRPFVDSKETHLRRYAAIGGYIMLKLMVYSIAALCAYSLMEPLCGRFAAHWSIAAMFFHHFAIRYIATYHTTEMQFINGIIVLYLFAKVARAYSWQKNVGASLVIGVLVLAKQNYAIYGGVLLFLLVQKKWKEAALSFLVHLMVLGAWLLWLKTMGLSYYNHELEAYGQGVWLYREFIYFPFLQQVKTVISAAKQSFGAYAGHYSVFAAGALIAVGSKWPWKSRPLQLVICCVIMIFMQMFAARRFEPYMAADLSLFIYGITGCFVQRTIKSTHLKIALLCLWFAVNIFYFVHIPWIHPYAQ